MATATEISTRALRRLKVVETDASPSATDVVSATEALTALINSWEADGLTGDILPLDARFEQGVVAMLAVRLAEEFGKTPGAVLVRDAETGKRQLEAAFITVPTSCFEQGLKYAGPFANISFLENTEDEPYSVWAPGTIYALRKYVTNNAMLYECVTAGTSDTSGGPTGTDAEITDGTVTWCWRNVVA